MNEALDITPAQMKTVRSLLARHLPGTAAWAYGSRAKWTARPESDLDLVVFATPAQKAAVSALRESFDESNLPFRVDLFVWDEVPEKFHQTIKEDRFVVQEESGTYSVRSRWPERKVSDLQKAGCLLVEDGNHGEYRPRRDEFTSDGISFIRAADMNDGRVLFESASQINQTAIARIRKGIGKGGDVLLSHKGTVGKLALVPLDAPPFVCSPQTTFWRSMDELVIDRRYLYAYMRSHHFHTQLRSRQDETDMAAYVSLTAQRDLIVLLPEIRTQRAIAEILGSLDDKIELNRRMNGTLESLARGIFKAWFIDFEPVKAKAAGATSFPGMTQNLFDQLPDKLIDSELGLIPIGWKVDSIGSACIFNYGKALKAENRRSGKVPVYGSNGAVGWHDEALVSGPGIVVGRKGNPGIVTWVATDFFPIDTTFYVSTKQESVNLSYLRYALEYLRLHTHGSDSAVPGLNRNMAYGLPVIIPDLMTVQAFDELFLLYQAMIYEQEKESRTLAAIRDALLPKLISGEIRVGGI